MKEKWYREIFLADNVASEVLDCEEAKAELTVEEMRELIEAFGEEDFVTVTDEKELVAVG